MLFTWLVYIGLTLDLLCFISVTIVIYLLLTKQKNYKGWKR